MISELMLAIVPIALLIILGKCLKHFGVLADAFWAPAEKLGYYVLLPALFIHGLATANLSALPIASMASVLILSTLLAAVVLVVLRPWMPVDGAAFTSVFQGGVRFNNYVGVSAAVGLFGSSGMALSALVNAATVPTVNILCVLVFSRFSQQLTFSVRGVCKQLFTNPLLVACVIGIVLQVTHIGLPWVLTPLFKTLGQASLPLGLLCVGAALDFSAAKQWVMPVSIASLVKFVMMPLMTLGLGKYMGLTGVSLQTAILFQALPTASSAYILARNLGGDAPLMAGIIAVQTLLAAIALPMVMWLLW
ncbi:AEC family transporter [Leeia sp. TBRC 13508]|uniref:AEC family transporter n=1 Tax=Leeia speluncae TaxID=2884804 RepID=A0ABS8D493_9NEIS|nr:AEC family transporter [Leeia speluncae]MCB6183015.1 AEC family transporter [Leeia speluncae]